MKPKDQIARTQEQWALEMPDLDVTALGIVGRLQRISAELAEQLGDVSAKYGLCDGDYEVLAALRRGGRPYEAKPSELAAETQVTSGAMTKRVDRLEASGLVTRRTSTTDARCRAVALTPKGKRLIGRAITDSVACQRQMLEQLSNYDRITLEGALTRWLAVTEPGD